MAIEIPPALRSSISESTGNLTIKIPARRNIFIILFMSVWIVGWFFGETSALHEIFSPKSSKAPETFLIVWVTAWTIGGGYALSIILWQINGFEIIMLGPRLLVVRLEAFGIGRSKEYDILHITNLRVIPTPKPSFFMQRDWGFRGGLIAFDYGSSTINFGLSIDESEAASLIQKLSSHYNFQKK